MRVIAGELRGRRLIAPRGRATRPTPDRVRESVFAILGESVRDARVLDLFAGSGALAIEALSRGASEATLIDVSAAAIGAVTSNLQALELAAEVRRQPAGAFLEQAIAEGRLYDLVFLDPPYRDASALGRELSTALRSGTSSSPIPRRARISRRSLIRRSGPRWKHARRLRVDRTRYW